MEYNHKEIEKKWQKYWEDNHTFKVNLESNKPKYYVLDMFPYPSGSGLHVGHPEGYTATDIMARFKRMMGYEVLHPIGFDSFGLPAEQYAISTGNSPREFTLKNIEVFKKQLKSLGFSYNWEQELITSEPYYYKHTQWIFAQLFKHGLAEIRKIEVNWCEELNTVLSNEEIILVDDKMTSERGGFPVVKRPMKQWVLKITKYADRLFEGLENLDWPLNIKKLQKNWIYNEGKKEKGLHLNDWIFARQRYWGEPFPIVHLQNGELYLIPESNYPLELPVIDNYLFSKDGKPALANATEWVKYSKDGINGEIDLNTMPQWAASSWYYIAYVLKRTDSSGNSYILDLDSSESKKLLEEWLPVNLYIGGQEHAVLHLLYARFWHMFLYDIGIVKAKEPFLKLFNQGLILGEDGEKMSKSRGNTVSPDEIIEEYGADSLRIYEMFMGPLADAKPWSNTGIRGIRSWLDRVFNVFERNKLVEFSSLEDDQAYNEFLISFEKNVSELKYNNAISNMMVFINHIYSTKQVKSIYFKTFLQALSLFAPHLAQEIWFQLDFKEDINYMNWPKPLELNIKKERKIIVQQNGKLKKIFKSETFLIDIDNFNQSLTSLDQQIQNELNDLLMSLKIPFESVKVVVYLKDKLLNFIV